MRMPAAATERKTGAGAEPRLIAALAYPGVQLLDITGPLEAFNLAAQQMVDDGETRRKLYRVLVIGRERGEVETMSGLSIRADRALDDSLADVDTLLIPGALTGARFYEDPQYQDWVRSAEQQVRRVCSVCSGALLLAAAGLLDGKRATTHWMDAQLLRDSFPRVRVEASRIYTEDGGIFTSGGITAGIDLALALIERDHSRKLALKTAKRLVVFLKRPGDQLQFNSFLAAQMQPTPFDALLDWIVENLHADLGTTGLAKRACLSERSFRRRFEAALGLSPQQYIAQARINKAQSLMESTALSLGDIARRCGYGSADAMRYAFAKTLEVTPSEYRKSFGNP
jgi:transcriptional regulator GlxA family with amidase domain